MKKLLSFLVCYCSFTAFAQNGFFIQPSLGYGMSNVNCTGVTGLKSVPAYDAQIGVCYQKNNLGINTGVSYFRTGTKESLFFEPFLSGAYDPASTFFNEYFYHFAVPLMASYQMSIGSKLWLVPALGVQFSYNLSERTNLSTDAKEHDVPQPEFNNEYNQLSIFGAVQLNAEYKLSKKISLTGGPEILYMLDNMFKVPAGAIYVAKQHNYADLINVGIKWHLTNHRTDNKSLPLSTQTME